MSGLSPLEEHFPRLVTEIVAFWGSPTCFDQLQGLLVDTRGGRQGFPEDVYSDLSLLLTLVPRPKGPYDIWSEAADADKTA
ncbi:MAG: hypothetical protein ABS93_02335 [Thiobacillus sp. SCN 62-729]|nr:MAG: hypothetical protein ABS93_02335 [Thiobacillus sp. SCN 62-729]